MNSTDSFLCAVCAVTFASTLILLLLSLLQQLTRSMKTRLVQMAFSFCLTAVVVLTLAHT